MNEVKKVEFGCCFCGEVAEDDRVAVALFDRDDKLLQQWWAHEPCFRGRLHQDYDIQTHF